MNSGTIVFEWKLYSAVEERQWDEVEVRHALEAVVYSVYSKRSQSRRVPVCVGNSMGVCPVAGACVCVCVGGSVRARGQVRVCARALLVFVCVNLCLP